MGKKLANGSHFDDDWSSRAVVNRRKQWESLISISFSFGALEKNHLGPCVCSSSNQVCQDDSKCFLENHFVSVIHVAVVYVFLLQIYPLTFAQITHVVMKGWNQADFRIVNIWLQLFSRCTFGTFCTFGQPEDCSRETMTFTHNCVILLMMMTVSAADKD